MSKRHLARIQCPFLSPLTRRIVILEVRSDSSKDSQDLWETSQFEDPGTILRELEVAAARVKRLGRPDLTGIRIPSEDYTEEDYAISFAFLYFLEQRFGPTKMRQFIQETMRNHGPDKSMLLVLGYDRQTLESEFGKAISSSDLQSALGVPSTSTNQSIHEYESIRDAERAFDVRIPFPREMPDQFRIKRVVLVEDYSFYWVEVPTVGLEYTDDGGHTIRVTLIPEGVTPPATSLQEGVPQVIQQRGKEAVFLRTRIRGESYLISVEAPDVTQAMKIAKSVE